MNLLARLDAVIRWIQPRPGTDLDTELRAIRTEIEKRDEAVRKFLAKMDEVESSDSYRSVWTVSQLHVGPYNGLTWTEEKARLQRLAERMSDARTVLSVRIFGDPVAQGRPRATIIAGHVHVYDPNKSRDWKRTVQAQVIAARNGLPPTEEPLRLKLRFYLRRPKSLPKRVVHHVKRPDCENLGKAVQDAMNGIVYRDDSQVVELVVSKEYSAQPGVDIQVLDARTPPP